MLMNIVRDGKEHVCSARDNSSLKFRTLRNAKNSFQAPFAIRFAFLSILVTCSPHFMHKNVYFFSFSPWFKTRHRCAVLRCIATFTEIAYALHLSLNLDLLRTERLEYFRLHRILQKLLLLSSHNTHNISRQISPRHGISVIWIMRLEINDKFSDLVLREFTWLLLIFDFIIYSIILLEL